MVYDPNLGYDPEEWEECPEPEHFLVFSPFTRYLLTAAAIAFVYYFFKILDEHKNKGDKETIETTSEPQTKVEQVVADTREKLHTVGQQLQSLPNDAEELIREADQYLRGAAQPVVDKGRSFVNDVANNLPSVNVNIGQPIRATEEYFAKTLSAVDNHLSETSQKGFLPPTALQGADMSSYDEPRIIEQHRFQQQQIPPYQQDLHFNQQEIAQSPQQLAEQHFYAHNQQPLQDQRPPIPYHQQHVPGQAPPNEQMLLREFDVYDQQMSDPRMAQYDQFGHPLQMGSEGMSQDNSLTRSKKLAREKRLSEQDERALQDWEQEKVLLEAERIKKLLDHEVGGESSTDLSTSQKAFDHFAPASHISYDSRSGEQREILQPHTTTAQRAEHPMSQFAQQQPLLTMSNVRDSQLTDYDISDFNAHEVAPIQEGGAWQEVRQKQAHGIEQRRITGDSDDYVKVSEPIYDYPPTKPEPKSISPTEAAQLQELCQEYDFGLDLPGVAPPGSKPPTAPPRHQSDQRNANVVAPFGTPTTAFDPYNAEAQQVQHSVRFQQQPDIMHRQNSMPRPSDEPKSPSVQVRQVPITKAPSFDAPQAYHIPIQKGNGAGGFVMEEEMLSSHGAHGPGNKKVFERVETDEHDDMTYAPEIQSVEIPPDQLSETSENMIDYFDKVAAETDARIADLQQDTLKRHAQGSTQAPQILPAFGNRVASQSSIGSGRSGRSGRSPSGISSSDAYPYNNLRKQSSLLSVLGVTSMQEVLLTINSLDALSEAMRRAGLETTNMIFGIDYTASNKYQGEESFGGRSLHTIHPAVKNPYQQVITILGRTLAPFAGHGHMGVYGFGDAKTGDWSVFPLKPDGDCTSLEEVLKVYNEVTPTVALSGPTNFAPLIYQAMEICCKSRDYHILVIIADGQVTNERATRRAIVQACQHPLSIIVVGVGDGPWDMMRVFDESLPKRPWDNFHFVEFHEIMKKAQNLDDGDVKLAVQSLLEIPDQYRCICELGLLDRSIPPRGSEIRRELMHNPL